MPEETDMRELTDVEMNLLAQLEKVEWPPIDPALIDALEKWLNPQFRQVFRLSLNTSDQALAFISEAKGSMIVLNKLNAVSKKQREEELGGTRTSLARSVRSGDTSKKR